jgi:alkaline phosphatase D
VAELTRELVAGDRPARFGVRPACWPRAAASSASTRPSAAHPGATPHSGDFTDAYGNRMRVLAVANPKLTKATFRAARRGRNAELGDRDRRREGYGLVRVDTRRRRLVIECWPWDGGPQLDGWAYELPFPQA